MVFVTFRQLRNKDIQNFRLKPIKFEKFVTNPSEQIMYLQNIGDIIEGI